MKKGLYEQVINKQLNRELDQAEDLLKSVAPIDRAEAARILAKYLAEIIEKGMENVKDQGGDIQTQIDLANKLVQTIISETNENDFDGLSVDQRGEQLLALLNKQNSVYAVNEKAEIIRPQTSLAQSSLFTGAIHEPSMYTELKKEIVSADRIDMLVSFIKWSGLRLIIDELRNFTQRGGWLRIITTSYIVSATPYCPAIDGVSCPEFDEIAGQRTPSFCCLSQLTLNNQLDHMIINNPFPILGTI